MKKTRVFVFVSAIMMLCAAVLQAEKPRRPAVTYDYLYRGFQNPAQTYSLQPYWFWNGRITRADTQRQMEEMIAQGVYGAIVFPWNGMGVKYLSEDYWDQMGAALNIAAKLGFTLNIADDYTWPSGHAWDQQSTNPELSRVIREHPAYRMKRIDYTEYTVEGPREWSAELQQTPEFVLAGTLPLNGFQQLPVSGKTIRWSVPPGRWLITAYYVVPAVGPHNTRLDMLNPAAVKAYIDTVYEEYARRFPRHLGKTLRLTVADHEGAYGEQIAYTPRLWGEFQRRKGYDLRGVLPFLVNDSQDPSRSRKVRQDYLDVISNLYVEAFTRQVTDWCQKHDMEHGTSLYEEQMSIQVNRAGDMFRHWRASTAVFIDALMERARMPIDFKEAASVAHFEELPLLVENQGLQGIDSYFSLEKARLGTNMCLLWGANKLVPYFDYDPNKTQYPPQWFLSQPFWRYFHKYASYVRRGQFMNAKGRHVAPVALYYPLESAFRNSNSLFRKENRNELVWGNSMDTTQDFYTALQLELVRQGWDYHVLDSYYLQKAELSERALKVGDESFRVLILPPMSDMDARSIARVREFVKAGGTVLAAGALPAGLSDEGIRRFEIQKHEPFMNGLSYSRRIETPAGIKEDLKPLFAELRRVLPPELEVTSGDSDGLYWSHRTGEDLDWYWMVNDTPKERTVSVRFPAAGRFEKWDAETGDSTPLAASGAVVELRFGPWDGFFVVQREGTSEVAPAPREALVMELPKTGWKLTLDDNHVRVPYALREEDSEQVWLAPEAHSNRDWWLIGPFPYKDHQGFFDAWPPEKAFDPAGAYDGAFGQVKWQWAESPENYVTLQDALNIPRDQARGVYYAFVNVYSPVARRATVRAAFADSLAVWWNGQRMLIEHRHPKWLMMRDIWAESCEVDVRRGWNKVLLKIGPSLERKTAFIFRIADSSGETLRDLIFSKDTTVPDPGSRRVRLSLPVPPGATALETPRFGRQCRILVDGREMASAGTSAMLALLPKSRSCTFEIDQSDEPEHPITFQTGEVDFNLASWTDAGLAHYSGTGIYTTHFELTKEQLNNDLILDLGEVGVAAGVWVNGKKAGERAWRPYRFDISSLVRKGKNLLWIRVANSDAGALAQGDTIYPRNSWGLKLVTERDRVDKIRPNGLEGPVRIYSTPKQR